MLNNPEDSKKNHFHPRNRFQSKYDFEVLCQFVPELKDLIVLNKIGGKTIDFSDGQSVKLLNKAILLSSYPLQYWDIPDEFLTPPIPGRADYIHYAADLFDRKKDLICLDIGVGANCIYPIIAAFEYGWCTVGSEVNTKAIISAKAIVDKNPELKEKVIIKQQKKETIFFGIIEENEFYDISICNPPFHASRDEANKGIQRKWRNINKNKKEYKNFGGNPSELWCQGGEKAFISKMIDESRSFKNQVRWFTSLVSKEKNLPSIYAKLKNNKVKEFKTINMYTANKMSRIIAWTFMY